MPQQQKLTFKVYVGAMGDFVRSAAGDVIFWDNFEEAEKVAQQERGMVLPGDASSPGGFDPARLA